MNKNIAVLKTPHRYGTHMPAEVIFPLSPQPKLVLD